jgi:hypothetical protein
MKFKIDMSTAILIGDYETGKDYGRLIYRSPRKGKKFYKKELSKVLSKCVEKLIIEKFKPI